MRKTIITHLSLMERRLRCEDEVWTTEKGGQQSHDVDMAVDDVWFHSALGNPMS